MAGEKKHILILPRWYPNRLDIQLGIFIRRQALLIKDAYEVSVIYVQADPELKNKFETSQRTADGINEQIIYFRSDKGPLRKLINAQRYRKAQMMAYNKLRSKPDLCHVHVPYRSIPLALTLQKQGIPFVITEHWSGHLNGQYEAKNAVDKSLYKRLVSKAERISTVSKILQAKFKKNTGFDSVVIPNYIEKSEIVPPSSEGKITILTVADLVDDTKNITGLLSCYKLFLDKLNKDLQEKLELRIIGGGPDEIIIRTFEKMLNFPKGTVTFEGRLSHEEVKDVMTQCDFYICNSNFETFGMTVAEALLAGKPVITTRCGGPEEFVNESNGIVIEPRNKKELVNAMHEMLEKYGSYNAHMISAALDSQFGRERILSLWQEFYEI